MHITYTVTPYITQTSKTSSDLYMLEGNTGIVPVLVNTV